MSNLSDLTDALRIQYNCTKERDILVANLWRGAADTIEKLCRRVYCLRDTVNSKWQPIETFPDDGSVFLACGGEYPEPNIFKFCKYLGIDGMIIPVFDNKRVHDEDDNDVNQKCVGLTHWMPLPSKPTGIEK